MKTITNPDLKIPTGLSREGRKAALAILALSKAHDMQFTGGCKAFYTPKEWGRHEGQDFGKSAVLAITHDGGQLKYFFSYDAAYGVGTYKFLEQMAAKLQAIGLYAESMNCWSTIIYKTN